MTWLRPAVALGPALLGALLSSFDARAQAQAAPAAPAAPAQASPVTPPASPAVAPAGPGQARGVDISIDAPPALKALLERHLDVVRLGAMARDEVDDSEWSRLIDAAPLQARELLQTEGYFSPQLQIDREAGRSPGQPDQVRMTVQAGPRARVSKVSFLMEGELERSANAGDSFARATLDQQLMLWDLPQGKDFRNGAWSDAKAAALARLRAAGYAAATWGGTSAEVNAETNLVALTLVADSGPLFRYGELQVEGLSAQDVETVRNLVNADRGTPVTEALVLDFQDRLQKSGLFENISVTLDPDPKNAGQARIVARVTEAPLQSYTFGLGISANTGPRASVDHTYRRVFGYAVTAHNKLEIGKLRKIWNGEISSHPGPSLYRNLIGAAVEELESDTDVVLSQRLRLGRTQDGQRIERFLFLEAERSKRRTKDLQVNTQAVALSLNYHGVWRDLDSVVLPTRGVTLTGQVGVGQSRGTDAEPGPYGRLYLRLTGYYPVGDVWYGQARAEFGRVFLKSNNVVPEPQQFRAGGDDSVRGYGYRSLGPLVNGAVGSGNMLYTVSAELARPVSAALPSLWGAVFVDAGNAGNSFTGLRPVVGLGVGVRWRSPVGPLRVDWAYGREVRKSRIHFSVGIAF
jgi:translocation and assembly module TamA